MVATRRSGANTASTSNISAKATKRRKITDTSTVAVLDKPVTIKPSISRNLSLSTNSTALSKPNSAPNDLPVTSSSTGETCEKRSSTKPDPPLHDQAIPSTEQVESALQKLVTPGSSHNPIDLIEDSPPRAAQAKMRQHGMVEPHMFQDRHSKLYTYRYIRPALAPKPANGSTFTGQRSHDIYRMHTAKMNQPAGHPGRTLNFQQGLPFELRYPMSAQYLAPKQAVTPFRPDVQHYAPHTPTYPLHTPPPPPTEEQLRRKAVHFVQEYLRSSPRKREMAEDPEKPSEPELEEVDKNNTLSSRKNSSKQASNSAVKPPFITLPDPHFQLRPLIEHASLLTSLLRAYSDSADQGGLREDIAMLASVQNQHVADWLNFEVGQSRKQSNPHIPRVSRIGTSSPVNPYASHETEQEKAETEKEKHDDEIRSLLSANAMLWQDGSGLGVADVYAGTRASTPAASQNEEDEPQGGPAVVSVSSPVRCKVKTLSPSPEKAKVFAPLAIGDTSTEVSRLESKETTPPSLPATRHGARSFVTPSPRVARTVSSPAVRTSGRKRLMPARFRAE